MKIEIRDVKVSQKEILRNLLEKYLYESSKYDNSSLNNLGLYGYDYLDLYWIEENRRAFFIIVDDEIAGFAMINDERIIDVSTQYTMAEFFITYPFRNRGIGTYVATKLFLKFKGGWQLKYHPKNIASSNFWQRTINDFCEDEKIRLYKKHPKAEYTDEIFGDVYVFTT